MPTFLVHCDYVLRKGGSVEGIVSLKPRVPILPQVGRKGYEEDV